MKSWMGNRLSRDVMVADLCAHLHLFLPVTTSSSVSEVGRSRGMGICCRWAGGSDQIAWVAG